MVRKAIIDTLENSWPMFVILLVIMSTLRIADAIINGNKIVLYKEFINIGFISYILCLFYVVSFDDVEWSSSNFRPFQEILRYDVGSRLFFKNIMSNLLMFIPYGLLVGYYLDTSKLKPVLIMSFITSITIELTQLMIGRVFDVDDIILNVLGALIGLIIYKILLGIKKILPNFIKKDWFYNLLSIFISVFIVFYIFNLFNLGGFPW